jgi:hypothetical protein
MKSIVTFIFCVISLGSFAQQDLAIELIYPQTGDTTVANMTYVFKVWNNGSTTIPSGTALAVEFVGIGGSLTNTTPFSVTPATDLLPGGCDTFNLAVSWNVVNPPTTFDICLWLLGPAGSYDLSGGVYWGQISSVLTNDPTPLDNETCIVQTIGDNVPATNITLSNNTINENEVVGTPVGLLTTTDPDSADTHVYTFVNGSGSQDNADFQISGSILISAVTFDYEAQSTLHVRIQTEDQMTNTYEKIFTINVIDLAEVGIESTALDVPQVKVYPQPFSDQTIIEFPVKVMRDDAMLHVYDAAGKLVSTEAIQDSRHAFNRNSLADGIYQFHVISNDQIAYRGRIVVGQ